MTADELNVKVLSSLEKIFFDDPLSEILEENKVKLEELSKYLYEKETITGEEFMSILNDSKN